MKYSIIIIEDHALLKDSWVLLMDSSKEYEVVGTFASAEEALDAKGLQPDIALVDINLPGINGIEATPQLLKLYPKLKIIGVSMHTQPAFVKKMIQNGASGYVSKTSNASALFEALREVMNGKKFISREIKEIIAKTAFEADQNPVYALSQRELEIIRLLKEGKSSKEIAGDLFISARTVEVHRYNILKKLNLRNVAALIQFANSNPAVFGF
jgi:two-component system invasion response regulator UvrY